MTIDTVTKVTLIVIDYVFLAQCYNKSVEKSLAMTMVGKMLCFVFFFQLGFVKRKTLSLDCWLAQYRLVRLS